MHTHCEVLVGQDGRDGINDRLGADKLNWADCHPKAVVPGLQQHHYITLRYVTSRHITLHCITLHYITLHYIKLQYATLATLYYITLHYVPCYLGSKALPGAHSHQSTFFEQRRPTRL